jgi:hypothetical protein
MNDVTKLIKRAAVDATMASDPMALLVGTVLSIAPLKVNIEQKLTLGAAQLMMTEYISNRLALGDQVMLLQKQGGQVFVIIDKVIKA